GPEPFGPERLLQWKQGLPFFRERLENPLGRGSVIHLQENLESLRSMVRAGLRITAADRDVADLQRRVINLASPVGANVTGCRRAAPRHHEGNRRAEASLVEFERGLTLTIEGEQNLRRQLHRPITARILARWCQLCRTG